MLWIGILTVVIYIAMVFCSRYRTAIALIGSGVLLILGAVTGSYDVSAAFLKFPGEIIILIIVLALFTDNFDRLGLINFIGNKYLALTKEKKSVIMITMPILICLVSLFMNNLTVVLLFSYMALYFSIEYKLPIIPLLVSIIIGSNIGGAALPWADTPAVIITLYTDFSLIDFINKLLLPCIVLVVLLSIYTYFKYKKIIKYSKRDMPFKNKRPVDWKGAIMPLILFALYIAIMSIAPFYNISIAYVSLFFGGLLIFFDRKKPMDTLNDLPIMDSITFFIALFIIGGVLQYTGILDLIANTIMSYAGNNIYMIIMLVLILAFVMAAFLSAGPAASTLIPICITLAPLVPFKLIYAALALGILAGSSMFPWSATGGPILLSQTNEFLKRPDICSKEDKHRIREIFNLKSYLGFSMPFSFIILLFSAAYLALMAYIC